jgi:hypothetical protein
MMTSPVKQKINQVFSQRQADMRFVGAAKLPFRSPPMTTTAIPQPIGLLMNPPEEPLTTRGYRSPEFIRGYGGCYLHPE